MSTENTGVMPGQERYQFLKPLEVPGLTPEIISSLDDIVGKFGQKYPLMDRTQDLIIFQSGDIPGLNFQLLIFATQTKDESKRIITRVGKPGLADRVDTTKIIETNEGLIYWDEALSVVEAVDAINKIGEIAKDKGLIDPETGERISAGRNELTGKDPAPEPFYEPSTIFKLPIGGILFPEGADIEGHTKILNKGIERLKAILQERNINPADDQAVRNFLANLSIEDIRALRKRVREESA